MSDLQDMHEALADDGLRVYALNVPQFAEDALTIAAFKEQAGLTYPVLNHQGTVSLIEFGGNNSFPFPRDVIVGRDGRIAYTSRSYEPSAIQAIVAELLAESAP